MSTTLHQFIDKFPAKTNHKRAILGTIHPPELNKFWIPFFYGNRGSFWHRFAEAFPHLNFSGLQDIIQTLATYDVWVSDVVRECVHIDSLATDNQLDNIILNDKQIKEGLLGSSIDEIFFTSEYAFKLFKSSFGIRVPFDRNTREVVIDSKYFGRQIRAVILYSPSANANIGIAKSKVYKLWAENQQAKNLLSTVNAFRAQHYRDKMAFWGQK